MEEKAFLKGGEFKKVRGKLFLRKNLWRVCCVVVCLIVGYLVGNGVVSVVIGGICGCGIVVLEAYITKLPIGKLISGTVGLVVGLLIANLLAAAISFVLTDRSIWNLLLYILLGYLGIVVGAKRSEHIMQMLSGRRIPEHRSIRLPVKILDTSTLIDGRIEQLCQTNFLEGTLIVPRFVLAELHRIADSSDPQKRTRGRRGLDVINQLQKLENLKVRISDIDFPEEKDVDVKLIKLAKSLGGKMITNDYNLKKIASIEGVEVLNINEVVEALRPIYIPGEQLCVQIIKEGKEFGQGVGYLHDGTMVVVEKGIDYIGKKVKVLVTSVLQTASGRIIFTKLESLAT